MSNTLASLFNYSSIFVKYSQLLAAHAIPFLFLNIVLMACVSIYNQLRLVSKSGQFYAFSLFFVICFVSNFY